MTMISPPPPYPATAVPFSQARQSRPALLTVVGVTSIVIASLSLVVSGVSGIYAMGVFMYAQTMNQMAGTSVYAAAAPPPPQTVAVPPVAVPPVVAATTATTAPAVGARGLPPEQRKALIRDIDRLHRLRIARQTQLDQLLAEAGLDLGFTFGPDGRAANLRADLVDEGELGAASPGAAPDDFLVTRAGRIEIFDDRASFSSTDGAVTFRTVAGTPGRHPIDGPTGLTRQEAALVLSIVQRDGDGDEGILNPAQVTALTQALMAADQGIVSPGQAGMSWARTQKQPNGTVTVTLNGTIVLGPDGTVISQTPATANFGGGWGGGGMTAAAGPAVPPVTINFTAASLVIFESVVSVALAIFLLVAGILVLRQSPNGGRLHAVYACLKIPLAIGGAAAVAWLWWSFSSGVTPGAAAPDTNYAITAAALGALVACLHPIALLIALSRRQVREYYQAVRRAR